MQRTNEDTVVCPPWSALLHTLHYVIRYRHTSHITSILCSVEGQTSKPFMAWQGNDEWGSVRSSSETRTFR